MPEQLAELWKYAPVIAVTLFALWAGHRGWWYFGANAREAIRRLEMDRDQWRRLALALLKKTGVDLPLDDLPKSAPFNNGVKKNG